MFCFTFSNGSDRSAIKDNNCGSLTINYSQDLFAKIGTYVIIALAVFNLLKEVTLIGEAFPAWNLYCGKLKCHNFLVFV